MDHFVLRRAVSVLGSIKGHWEAGKYLNHGLHVPSHPVGAVVMTSVLASVLSNSFFVLFLQQIQQLQEEQASSSASCSGEYYTD